MPEAQCPNMLHTWPLPKSYVAAGEEADDRLAHGWCNVPCPDCGEGGWLSPSEVAQYFPRIINNVEALDALPFLTVVKELRDTAPSGEMYGIVYEKTRSDWTPLNISPKTTRPLPPVIVLWQPALKGDEAQFVPHSGGGATINRADGVAVQGMWNDDGPPTIGLVTSPNIPEGMECCSQVVPVFSGGNTVGYTCLGCRKAWLTDGRIAFHGTAGLNLRTGMIDPPESH